MRVTLTGTSSAVPLGNDYYVVAPSLRGDIEVARGLQGLGRGPTVTSVVLDAAIANAGLIQQVNLEFISVTQPANTRVGRGTEPPVTLVAPDLGARTGHVLLVINQAGALSWIFPAPASTARSRSREQVTFAIPTSETADERGRGIIGTVGIKVLKAFVYPITDEMLGGKIATLVNDWEEKHRAYHVRSFRPGDYRRPDPRELTKAEWDALRKGRSLLFVHGTFSTSHGAFGDLEPTTFTQLFAMYQGRVIAFDHHTMSHTPEQNVQVLLERMPAGSPIDVDIICHSRGGLVARELAERRPQAPLRVHKVVFVGATNAGTILADP
ncbi:MAG TPA: alpha/beta hydrolase, partial [Thermoanaerobaculia bacterium]|nr:alpha/beta hydrolase [Thermoanaerobaculia bacterium]